MHICLLCMYTLAHTHAHTGLQNFIRLMQECWAQDPAQRPTFESIARRLKAMQRWRMVLSRHQKLRATVQALRLSSLKSTSSSGSVRAPGTPQGSGVAGQATPAAAGRGSGQAVGAHQQPQKGPSRPGTSAKAAAAAVAAVPQRRLSAGTSGGSTGSSLPLPAREPGSDGGGAFGAAAGAFGAAAGPAAAGVAATTGSFEDDDDVLPLADFGEGGNKQPRGLTATPSSCLVRGLAGCGFFDGMFSSVFWLWSCKMTFLWARLTCRDCWRAPGLNRDGVIMMLIGEADAMHAPIVILSVFDRLRPKVL